MWCSSSVYPALIHGQGPKAPLNMVQLISTIQWTACRISFNQNSSHTAFSLTIELFVSLLALFRRHIIPNALSSGQADKLLHSHPVIIQPVCRTSKPDGQQAVRHTTCGGLRNSQGLDREVGEERGGEVETDDGLKLTGAQQLHTWQGNKSFTLGNIFPDIWCWSDDNLFQIN